MSAFLALAGPRRILRFAPPPRPQLRAAERSTVLQQLALSATATKGHPSETPTWKWVVGALLVTVSALGLLINATEIPSVRAAPEDYPFAVHFAAEYGWGYLSAWHYELSCWIGLGMNAAVILGVVGWLWSRRWWPLMVGLAVWAVGAVVPRLLFL